MSIGHNLVPFYEKIGMVVRSRMVFYVIGLKINHREDFRVPSSLRLRKPQHRIQSSIKTKIFAGSFKKWDGETC